MNDKSKNIDLKNYFTAIKKKHPYDYKLSFLLAFSGGIDSMVLLHATYLCGLKPILAHCNFQLRGDNSLKDEAFAKEIAKKYNLPINTKRFLIDNNKNIQLQARELRYHWFEQLMEDKKIPYCLIGHHSNDYLETVLINMVRGTGISGLQLSDKRGRFYRPLINYTKLAIINYADKHNLKWREDNTNDDTKYRRNYIRHNIIPHLKQLNPNIERTIGRNMNRLNYTQRFFDFGINNLKKNHIIPFEDGIQINIESITSELGYTPDALLIFACTKDFHFSYKQCEQITQNTYKQDYFIDNVNRDYRMYIGQSQWYIFPLVKIESLVINNLSCKIDYYFWSYKLEVLDKKPTFEETESIVILPISNITLPLKLRLWKNGDRFLPLGMKGKSKKLSDFLTDIKLPLAIKKRQVVLKDRNNIIWVVGHRKSEIIREDLSTSTSKYLIIERKKSNNEVKKFI